MKKSVVAGLGEIGTPVLKLLSKKNIIIFVDKRNPNFVNHLFSLTIFLDFHSLILKLVTIHQLFRNYNTYLIPKHSWLAWEFSR